MQGRTKRFCQGTHDKYDAPAREATKAYLLRRGYAAVQGDTKYCVDLVVRGVCYVECECKLGWSGPRFPWGSVRLPHRKKKFTELDMPVIFYVWNRQFSHAIRIAGELLTDDKLTEVSNVVIPSGEYFYDIPIESTYLVSKKD
jgi:hypothetical protein